MATRSDRRLRIKAQIILGDEIAMGPGKAELLEWIQKTGSITAAARSMGLSYRRAWLMLDAMNRTFAAPVVETSHGGAKGGGAHLSASGVAVLAAFRALEADLAEAAKPHQLALLAALARTVTPPRS